MQPMVKKKSDEVMLSGNREEREANFMMGSKHPYSCALQVSSTILSARS